MMRYCSGDMSPSSWIHPPHRLPLLVGPRSFVSWLGVRSAALSSSDSLLSRSCQCLFPFAAHEA